jgi:PEP-CTERM motif
MALGIENQEFYVLSPHPLKVLFRRGLATAVAAFTLGAAGPASATFVVGQWDPAYGAQFPNLGWRGTTTVFVDTSCLSLGPGYGFVANSVSCPMSLVSATVEFYALSNPVPTVETLTFTGLMTVSGIQLDTLTGALDGVILSLSAPVLSTSPLAQVGSQQASFRLEQVYSPSDDRTFAQLYWSVMNQCEPVVGGVNGPEQAAVRFSLRTVPEPGSLLLSGAALVLAGFVRRRNGISHL